MKAPFCPREIDLWHAIAAARWPADAAPDLRAHVASCSSCRDLALVASTLQDEAAAIHGEAAPPSSAIVWWRAQTRARQEAARLADQPISIVHAVAIASVAGLALGLLGSVAASIRGSASWFGAWTSSLGASTAQILTLHSTSPWLLLPMGLIAITLIAAPIALYAILTDES